MESMAEPRRYRLLCPIARALDRIGDRWTLLILRDLHAGPARFSELREGLSGIATNLLTDRLRQLATDGLIEQAEGAHGVAVYRLTDLGQRTRAILFELALFGGRFAPDEAPRKPGNLRTVAVTLSSAAQRVVRPDDNVTAVIRIDGEPYTLTARDGRVTMVAGDTDTPDVIVDTSYEPLLAVADGALAREAFLRDHARFTVNRPGKDAALMDLMGRAMAVFRAEV